jgi:hypothetical protein
VLGIKGIRGFKYLGINRDLEKGKYMPKLAIFIQINKSRLATASPPVVQLATVLYKQLVAKYYRSEGPQFMLLFIRCTCQAK